MRNDLSKKLSSEISISKKYSLKRMLALLCILATFNMQWLTAGTALGAQQAERLRTIMGQRQQVNINERVKELAKISPWYKVGGGSVVSVVTTFPGVLEIFGLELRDGVFYITHRSLSGTNLSRREDLGGNTGYSIKAVSLGDGRMAVFAVWLDQTLRCRYYDGGSWGEWQNLGGSFIGTPEVAVTDFQFIIRDRIDVMNTPKVFQKIADQPAAPPSQSPTAQPVNPNHTKMRVIKRDSVQAQVGQPATISTQTQANPRQVKKTEVAIYDKVKIGPLLNPPTRTRIAHVFVKNIDGTLWHREGTGLPGSWHAWQSLGGKSFNGIVATASTDKKVDVVIWNNNEVPSYGAYYWDTRGYKFSGWTGLNISAGAAPVLFSAQEDQLDLFCLGNDLKLYHRRRSGSSWSNWVVADNRAYPLAAMSIRSGIVELFVRKADFELYEIEWDGKKFVASKIGGSCAYVAGVQALDKPRFDLFLTDMNNAPFQKWWGASATFLPETGVQPATFPTAGEGQRPNAFGECGAGLQITQGLCQRIPPPPPPPPPTQQTPPPAPTPTVQKPSISVVVANGTFAVSGSGFTPNSTITIRVADDALANVYYLYRSMADGRLQAVVPNICVNPGNIYFSATDGRHDASDRTGSLWSNTVRMSCN
ncbi:MAG: hypothetical protein HY231_10900 [Acidobacteria bacterium]|nr:hypothetical protein [Acidobacteriota bacterium]